MKRTEEETNTRAKPIGYLDDNTLTSLINIKLVPFIQKID
jgi:hypothetical protein